MVHMYVRTYIHAYIHTYVHTCMHADTCLITIANIHTYVRTYIHAYMHVLLLKQPVPVPMEDDTADMMLESSSSCSHFYEVSWDSPIKGDPIMVGQLYYDRASQSLTMINKNTCLHRRCLLLGYTSKKEEGKERRSSIIGQFGVWLMYSVYYNYNVFVFML